MPAEALTFAATLPALLVAHNVADHWGQTGDQATHKHLPGWPGRLACVGHVASYTVATAGMVAGLWALFGLAISPTGFVLGQVVSAITHYWADRRFTLRALVARLDRIVPGKPEFYDNGGAYQLDQSWHWLWLHVAAALTALV